MGHVDGVARFSSIARAGNSWTYPVLDSARAWRGYVAEKGSVALDGVSLTVAARRGAAFSVAVIPGNIRRTTLGKPGARDDRINFEADVFARYGRAAALRRIRRAVGGGR